jgi:hypothetical protein
MTEPGNGFRQNGIGNRLAVSDDAVEVKNQCAHYFNLGKIRVRAFNMRPGMKGLAQPKTVEHFPLRCVSAGAQNARDCDPRASSLPD